MSSLKEQLKHAYRNEQTHYCRIRELVRDQARIMEREPNPAAVLELCHQVEELMAEVAAIEEAIEPAKKLWLEQGREPDEELNAVLGAVEEAIQEIGEIQMLVQEKLLEYVKSQQEQTNGTRAAINLRRARNVYKAG